MELELNDDFKDLLKLLRSKNVRYLLIGGYAVIAHGHPRFTSDLDIAIAADQDNVDRVLEMLKEFGFPLPARNPFSDPKSIVRLGVEPVKVEILNYLEGVNFEDAYARRQTSPTEDIEIDLISLEDLLVNKSVVGRDKDLLDVKELRRINNLI